MGDSFDFGFGIDQRIETFATSGFPFDAARAAEVNSASQFTHDHDIQPRNNLGLQRRSGGQFGKKDRWAEIGKQL